MREVTLEEARAAVKQRLSAKRYAHSLAVSASAVDLARKYGACPERAAFAGLIHDICKDDSQENQLQVVVKTQLFSENQ